MKTHVIQAGMYDGETAYMAQWIVTEDEVEAFKATMRPPDSEAMLNGADAALVPIIDTSAS